MNDIERLPFEFPVVLKIDAPKIAHKTEVGGVRTGIADLPSLRHAAREMLDRLNGRAEGVLVAEALTGIETLAGVVNDPIFGPMVVFGLGGIFAEALRDVSRRFAPFDRTTAFEMIDELRAAPILHGARTGAAYDLAALPIFWSLCRGSPPTMPTESQKSI